MPSHDPPPPPHRIALTGASGFLGRYLLRAARKRGLEVVGVVVSHATGVLSAADTENLAVLHRDPALMPRRRSVWASWNYLSSSTDTDNQKISLSYWMNRLQNLDVDTDLIVTLNPGASVDPSQVIDRWVAMHPQFDVHTDRAQREFPSIQGRDRIWYAGAYWGYGFHEDGARSGVEVARRLGVPFAEDLPEREIDRLLTAEAVA